MTRNTVQQADDLWGAIKELQVSMDMTQGLSAGKKCSDSLEIINEMAGDVVRPMIQGFIDPMGKQPPVKWKDIRGALMDRKSIQSRSWEEIGSAIFSCVDQYCLNLTMKKSTLRAKRLKI